MHITKMSKTLVIILSETRAHELTFESFKKNVYDELNADLCVCIGVKPDYDYENPFYKLAKYKFLYEEQHDYGAAFDYAYDEIIKNRPKYEKLDEVFYTKLIDTQIEDIHFISNDVEKFDEYEYDIILKCGENISNHCVINYSDSIRNKTFGINNNDENNSCINEPDVTTYKKPLHWREFLKIKDQFMGGIKDDYHEHPGSAAILIFFRWFLLKNLIESDLINHYDRFVITRSDFIYKLPHPNLLLMDINKIWKPNSEHSGGVTDRHVILSKSNIESYLNILNNMVLKSNQYFINMATSNSNNWNLERLIVFNLNQNNVLHLVREFPYIMYSVRNINGTTRWSEGNFYQELGYFIKYDNEYNYANLYKNEFEISELTIDDFYKKQIRKINNTLEIRAKYIIRYKTQKNRVSNIYDNKNKSIKHRNYESKTCF